MFSYNIRDEYIAVICFIWILTILLFHFSDLYQFESIIKPWTIVDRLAIAFATTFLFLFAITFALKVSEFYSRLWVGFYAISSFSLVVFFRFLIAAVIKSPSNRYMFARSAIVAGSGIQAEHIISQAQENTAPYISIDGIFTEDPQSFESTTEHQILGDMDDIVQYVRDNSIDDIFIALPWSSESTITSLVDKLRELPTDLYLIYDLAGFRLNLKDPPRPFP